MQPSENLIKMLKRCEGFSAKAYPDPGTGGEPYTIGYGHTDKVKSGDIANEYQAGNLLLQDLQIAVKAINTYVTWPLSQNQFDALVSFVFNVGVGNFSKSTLLKMINAHDFTGAADQFLRWNRSGGNVMAGLNSRRIEERELFISVTVSISSHVPIN